jgi:hypothetical protein
MEKQRSSSNKAKRDKDSILVDVKMLLQIYHPVFQRMPKIERIDGCAKEFKNACYDMIRHFCIAYNCNEAKTENIRLMIGDFGVMMASFDLVRDFGIATNQDLYLMAEKMERIEESVGKWRNATRHTLAST